MTKKEKKELALRIKAELLMKKGMTKVSVPIDEKQARNNRKRMMLQKSKMRRGDAYSGSKHKSAGKKDLDFEKW